MPLAKTQRSPRLKGLFLEAFFALLALLAREYLVAAEGRAGFVRTKSSGTYQYLQIVQNERIDGRVRQRVVATLDRLDVLQAKEQLDGLISS